jgi:ribosome assembly protein YihI (activator of Der GTPase)
MFLITAFLFLSFNTLAQNYRVGEQVEVLVEDVWFDAYIQEIDGKKYRLNYSRTSDETDFWVKEDKIRKRKGNNNPGDGHGSVSFEQTTGAKKPESKDTKAEVKPSQPLQLITLHNTCQRQETFVINDEKYNVKSNDKVEVEVELGTLIYSMQNGEKIIKGKVTEKIVVFRPSCN